MSHDDLPYLTLVYDTTGMDLNAIRALIDNDRVRYMAWAHVPYELRDLKAQLDAIREEHPFAVPL